MFFRFSDPYLNRFLQPDTITPDPYNPQSLNKYSYVNNSPINFSDPTGHWRIECGANGEECGGSGVSPVSLPNSLGEPGDSGSHHVSGGGHSPGAKGCGDIGQVRCNGNRSTYGDGIIGPPAPPDNGDIPYFKGTKYLKDFLDISETLAKAYAWGRPAYKQAKYALSFGGAEYAIDGGLQMYDDRGKNLNLIQRFLRGAIRYNESWVIDGLSQAGGRTASLAVQVSNPEAPGLAAGVGYFVGTYSTSSILDQGATKDLNPWLFNINIRGVYIFGGSQ